MLWVSKLGSFFLAKIQVMVLLVCEPRSSPTLHLLLSIRVKVQVVSGHLVSGKYQCGKQRKQLKLW